MSRGRKVSNQLEMLARLMAGQRDGRRRQTNDNFGGWVKMDHLDQTSILGRCRGPFVVSNAVSRLSLSSSTPEIFALKVAFELRSRRKRATVFGPQFFCGVKDPKIITAVC